MVRGTAHHLHAALCVCASACVCVCVCGARHCARAQAPTDRHARSKSCEHARAGGGPNGPAHEGGGADGVNSEARTRDPRLRA